MTPVLFTDPESISDDQALNLIASESFRSLGCAQDNLGHPIFSLSLARLDGSRLIDMVTIQPAIVRNRITPRS